MYTVIMANHGFNKKFSITYLLREIQRFGESCKWVMVCELHKLLSKPEQH